MLNAVGQVSYVNCIGNTSSVTGPADKSDQYVNTANQPTNGFARGM